MIDKITEALRQQAKEINLQINSGQMPGSGTRDRYGLVATILGELANALERIEDADSNSG